MRTRYTRNPYWRDIRDAKRALKETKTKSLDDFTKELGFNPDDFRRKKGQTQP